MKHPHHDLIAEWIKDTTRVVQVSAAEYTSWEDMKCAPAWNPMLQYRFKPVPKPDVVRCEPVHLNCDGTVSIKDVGGTVACRFVFDGETGKLKSAEVLT